MKLTLFLIGVAALSAVSAQSFDDSEVDVLPFYPITEEEYAALRHLGSGQNVVTERRLSRSGYSNLKGFFNKIRKNKPSKVGDENGYPLCVVRGPNKNNNNYGYNNGNDYDDLNDLINKFGNGNKKGNKWGNNNGNYNGNRNSQVHVIRVPRQSNVQLQNLSNLNGIACVVIVKGNSTATPRPTRRPTPTPATPAPPSPPAPPQTPGGPAAPAPAGPAAPAPAGPAAPAPAGPAAPAPAGPAAPAPAGPAAPAPAGPAAPAPAGPAAPAPAGPAAPAAPAPAGPAAPAPAGPAAPTRFVFLQPLPFPQQQFAPQQFTQQQFRFSDDDGSVDASEFEEYY